MKPDVNLLLRTLRVLTVIVLSIAMILAALAYVLLGYDKIIWIQLPVSGVLLVLLTGFLLSVQKIDFEEDFLVYNLFSVKTKIPYTHILNMGIETYRSFYTFYDIQYRYPNGLAGHLKLYLFRNDEIHSQLKDKLKCCRQN